MKKIRYLFQSLIIFLLFAIFKILGLKISSYISEKIFQIFGRMFRSNKICHRNLNIALPEFNKTQRENLIKQMWKNYGKIFAEYIFIKKFRENENYSRKIKLENSNELEIIKNDGKPVIFISGHFNNFEFMAMEIERYGINLAAIYRPLNNLFLNPIMEKIRKKYICAKQIKKGKSGTKEILKEFKNGTSIALMIDQRVSEGVSCDFFGQKAFTTTIPAQFVKKFNAKIIPIYIERLNSDEFKLKISGPVNLNKEETIETITLKLNKILEKMILKNPDQWIWTHNRWK